MQCFKVDAASKVMPSQTELSLWSLLGSGTGCSGVLPGLPPSALASACALRADHALSAVQRHEEPKLANEEYEQGTYVYFDFHIR